MADCLKAKIIKTRKPHKCWGCAREFPSGSTLEVNECVDNGDFHRAYWCETCRTVIDEWSYPENEEVSMGDVKDCDSDYWETTRAEVEGDAK